MKSKNIKTGRYELNNMAMLCKCGHVLGRHAAPNDTPSRPCFHEDKLMDTNILDCRCENFDSTGKEYCACGFPQSSPIPHEHSMPEDKKGNL